MQWKAICHEKQNIRRCWSRICYRSADARTHTSQEETQLTPNYLSLFGRLVKVKGVRNPGKVTSSMKSLHLACTIRTCNTYPTARAKHGPDLTRFWPLSWINVIQYMVWVYRTKSCKLPLNWQKQLADSELFVDGGLLSKWLGEW